MPHLLKFIFTAFFWLSILHGLYGQVTFIIPNLPESTPRSSDLFLAGSLNGWQPNDPGFKFSENENGQMVLTLNSVPLEFEYKICRGGWYSFEVDSLGRDVANRKYDSNNGAHVVVNVKGWRDRFSERQRVSTASKNVNFLPTSIEIPQLGRKRTVRVYFPPSYATRQGFPVIYMFDGQNLFDNSTSFSGEWGVDEILDSLHYSKGFSAIVVGIYHGDGERINEQTPWPNAQKQGGDGQKMAQFIVKTLKPYMDKHYRTLPDRENTIIAGSSLGGLMSLYMAMEYPEVFGKAVVLSPSLWWSSKAFDQMGKFKKRRFQKLYLYAGGNESETMLPNAHKAFDALNLAGFAENELFLSINPEGKHNEEYWGTEFYRSLNWLFGFAPIKP